MSKIKVEKINERELWIDVLKGIAILLVVVGHNCEGKLNSFIFSFHMPLFFLISGYLFSSKLPKKYFIKSFERLLIPYFSFLIILTIPFIIINIHKEVSIKENITLIISNLLGGGNLTGALGPLWFITVLFVANNVFNFIIYLKKIPVFFIFIPLLTIVGFLLIYYNNYLPWNLSVVPIAVLYLGVGYLLKHIYTYNKYFSPKYKFFNCIAIITLLIVYLFSNNLRMDLKYAQYGIPILSFVVSIISSIAISYFAFIISRNKKFSIYFSSLGIMSMFIMYVHQPIKFLILQQFNLHDKYLLVIFFALIFSYVGYILCKKSTLLTRVLLGERS